MSVRRSAWLRGVEAGLIACACALLLALAARATGALRETGAWILLAPAALLGYLAADFATGAIHWFGDRFFDERTPVIGRVLIQPFREHHAHPEAMTQHDLLELHGNSCVPVIVVLAVALYAADAAPGPLRAGFDCWLFVLLASALATNQFHLWAHARRAPSAVRWLQRHGVILSPERHARHHRGGFDRSYCITSGLLNPLLDRSDFFGHLERALPRKRRKRGR